MANVAWPDGVRRFIRPIKRPLENSIALLSVLREKPNRRPMPNSIPDHEGVLTYVLGNGAFGSLGDQALAAGTLALAQAKQQPVTLLIPGNLEKWRAVGVDSSEPLEPYAQIRLSRITPQGKRLFNHSNVIVIGADTIDGKYEHPFLSLRVNALNRAASEGHAAKLVNFSISEEPTRLSIYLLRQLDPRVELWARDSLSQERATRYLQREVRLAPDVAALMPPLLSPRVLEAAAARLKREMAVLVPNGHMASVFGAERRAVLQFWIDVATELCTEWDIIAMPHDTKPTHDDRGLAEGIVSGLAERDVPSTLFATDSAAEAKGLLSKAGLCVSGRMHACVAAMSSGTPAIGLDYLQKFEGQFAWYPDLGRTLPFENALDMSSVTESIDELLDHRSSLSRSIGAVTPQDIGWL